MPAFFVELLRAVILTQGWYCLPGTLGNVWRHFRWSQLGEVLLASGGWKPGILLTGRLTEAELPQWC